MLLCYISQYLSTEKNQNKTEKPHFLPNCVISSVILPLAISISVCGVIVELL